MTTGLHKTSQKYDSYSVAKDVIELYKSDLVFKVDKRHYKDMSLIADNHVLIINSLNVIIIKQVTWTIR